MSPGSVRYRSPPATLGVLSRLHVLRWVYVARVLVAAAVLVASMVLRNAGLSDHPALSATLILGTLLFTAASAWWTEWVQEEESRSFLFLQVAFDALLVTGVVYATGGGSTFAWLYILVISEGALLLPLPGGLLISLLAAVLYFAVLDRGPTQSLSAPNLLQLGLFAMVGVATGMLVDRLRKTGATLGDVELQLLRLRLDTSEILATLRAGVLTVDEGGHLVYMNPAAESLFELSASAWEGRPFLYALARLSPELARGLRLALDGDAVRTSLRVARGGKEGDRVLGASLFLRDSPGEPRAVTVLLQDITDAEQVEAVQRRTERLEALAELSAAMAHEIKNPLASIRSAVEQLSDPALSEADLETLRAMVLRESDRLSRLLTDFIAYSRVRLERVDPLDLIQIARDALALMQQHPVTRARSLRFTLDVPTGSLRIRADGDLLHRALFNLLLNAAQFSPQGGEILLALEEWVGPPIPVVGEITSAIRIRVRDQGPGIPAEERDRIFNPFFTGRPGGTGLGLAVVHRAAQAHGGAVWVEHPPLGGTEFQMYLPSDRMDSR